MNSTMKWARLTAVAVCVAGLLGWLVISKPWEQVVSISTTREAFVGPHPGATLIKKVQSQTMLSLGITPAPWPDEAHEVWRAASRGKRVRVTVRDKDRMVMFEITGVSPGGDLLIKCRSEDEAKRIVELLGIR